GSGSRASGQTQPRQAIGFSSGSSCPCRFIERPEPAVGKDVPEARTRKLNRLHANTAAPLRQRLRSRGGGGQATNQRNISGMLRLGPIHKAHPEGEPDVLYRQQAAVSRSGRKTRSALCPGA